MRGHREMVPLPAAGARNAIGARIDRGDKADLIDNEGFEGRPTIRRALATLGTIEGYAVGGCCDLSTSTHHLVQRLGVEQAVSYTHLTLPTKRIV